MPDPESSRGGDQSADPDDSGGRLVTRRFPATGTGLLLAAVLLVALNLRGAIAAVSPVLPDIRAGLSLSAPAAGLLTTLPVLCFAAGAPAAVWLARRAGVRRSIFLGCIAIAVGTVLRVVDGVPVLLLGTLLVGVAMTIGNVLVPVVVKSSFHRHAGTVTGLYTAALASGATITAALTAPIATEWGWRTSLAVWAALAVLAAAIWQIATRDRAITLSEAEGPGRTAPDAGTRDAGPSRSGPAADSRVWRDPTAWSVALFLGFQSICYYSVTTWLPTLLADNVGLGLTTAGAAMSVFQVLGVAGTLLIPLLVRRRPSQSWLGAWIGILWAVTLAGLLVEPSAWLLWSVTGGLAQGAGISFAFTVLILRAHDSAAATTLSGMAQLIGYTLGAAGPTMIGGVYDATHAWTLPLLLLFAAAAGQGISGALAGRNRTVGAPPDLRAGRAR